MPEQRSGIHWVGQTDAWGCGPAVMAMLTHEPYEAIKAEIEGQSGRAHCGDWNAEGVDHYALDEFLFARGFYSQRIYRRMREAWPPEPWAPLHFAAVEQPSHRSHFVAMDSAGRVLDPLREGEWKLSDWPRVLNVVGLVRDIRVSDEMVVRAWQAVVWEGFDQYPDRYKLRKILTAVLR